MWFRNLTLYRIPNFPFSADGMAAGLAHTPFQSCTGYSDRASGWTHARNGQYVYSVDGQHLIAMRMARKVLPPAVVKRTVAERCEAWRNENGRAPSRKMRKEIKEQVIEDLLPKAFEVQRDVHAWVSPRHGLLVVDTASRKVAESFIRLFIRAFETAFEVYPASFTLEPASAMTEWVASEPPSGFTVDTDNTTLVSRNGGSASIRYSGVALEADVARRQIEGGRIVSTLALTWDDKASFVLGSNGVIRRLAPVGINKVSKKEAEDDDVFASDFLLMTATVGDLLAELSENLNGFKASGDLFSSANSDDDDEADDSGPDDEGDHDPLIGEAKRIVIAENRASISMVQRHLRIGYNRAARLLEELEKIGVISEMDNRGNRKVIGEAA